MSEENSVDPKSIWGTAPSPPAQTAPSPQNIWSQPAPASPASSSSFGTDPKSIWGSPENGQTAPAPRQSVAVQPAPPQTHLYQDSSQPFYKRAWDFANTPTLDFTHLMSKEGAIGEAFGRTSDQGGFERGVENVVSGLTAPLSLALTAATFGTGGLIEAAGSTALREAGMTAAEIADAAKASEVAMKATRALEPLQPAIDSALSAGGHDLALLQKAKDVLPLGGREADLSSETMQNFLAKKGFSPDELKELAKTGDTISEATKNFTPVEDAVRASGADVDNWKKAQSILWDHKLTESDLLNKNTLENGAFQIMRKYLPDVPIAGTARAAKTANAVLNAGFTLQQLESAAAMSPRFLDALKEGDYDKAMEYGTEAIAGGALGIAGAGHAIHSWGELTEPLLSTKLRPSDTTVAVNREFSQLEGEHAVAEQTGVNQHKQIMALLGHEAPGITGLKPEIAAKQQLERVMVILDVHTGVGAPGSQETAIQNYNALAEAAGHDDRIGPLSGQVSQNGGLADNAANQGLVGGVRQGGRGSSGISEEGSGTAGSQDQVNHPENGQVFYHGSPADFEGSPKTDGLGAHFTPSKELAEKFKGGSETGKVVEANLGIKNPLRVEDIPGSHSEAQGTVENFVKQGVLPEEFLKEVRDGAIYKRSQEIVGDIGDLQGEELAKKRNDAFDQANTEVLERVKSYLKSKGYDGLVYENKVEDGGDSYVAFDQSQIRPQNGQDSYLRDQIANNKFKDQPKEYQDLVLAATKAIAEGKVPDNVRAAAKYIREEEAKTAEIGGQTGLLDYYVDNHQTRYWENANPEGKVASANAKSGKFATSVTAARRQVYDSDLTGFLKSPTKMIFDPANATAKGRVDMLKAAANKKWLGTIGDKGYVDSTGRPVLFLNGSGNVVAGANGEDPRIFIDANRANIRKLNIADSVIARLTANGDLQRFLEDGTIRDLTPRIHPDNINSAIARLEDEAGRRDAQYDAEGNNILRQKIDTLKAMASSKDFSDLRELNDAQPKIYAWNPQGYVSLANDAVKGWNFATNSPDGTPVYVRSDVSVSPEYAEYFKNRLGLEKSAIANNPIGKKLLGTGTKLKETLLSLSPFHMVQEALRGIMVGVNPFHLNGPDILDGAKVDPSDPNSPTKLRKGVENGLTTGTDYKSLQEHSEGLSAGKDSLISKIPGVGKVIANSMQWYQDLLFKRYIPSLKNRAFELMYDRYQEAHPDWSVDKVAKAAATSSNNAFGGINWRAMGRSATTQDWGRLMLLAPDWLEAEMRSGTRLFNREEGGLSRAQVAKMALGVWGIARVLNTVSTGNPHLEAPFGLAVKNKEGKETVFGIRTLPQDLLSAAADPVRFIKGRLSPTIRTGEELISGRDQYGRKMAPQDLWADVFRNMAPIPAQSIGQAITSTGPQVGNPGQVWKAVGGTAQTYQTPAQKLAADLASSHSEDGLVDPSQQARHRLVMQFEDQVRSGEMSWPDLMKLTYQDDALKESELQKIKANLSKTKEMDSSMASLYTRASRLPAKEYLDLLDVANPSEKAALVPLTLQVQRKYLTKAKKDMTPQERQQDPVFQKLLHLVPQAPTQQQ